MIIWITGASSGLGRELAAQYVRDGHRVCVSARGVEALEALAGEHAPGEIGVYPLDITDAAAAQAVFDRIVADVGVPDLCILNAGTHVPDRVTAIDPERFRQVMTINVYGTVTCLAALMPAFIARGSGHVAVVSSVAGYRGLPYAAAYGASKAALINMCEGMQPELAACGVRLSVVNPGFVRTPLTDRNRFSMPFLMEVDDAARSMRRGLASGRFEITFPKRFTWLLKGFRLLPIAVYLWFTRRLLRKG